MEILAAGLYGLDLMLLISFQFLNRDEGIFTHAVSNYGLGRSARWFRAYVIAGSLAAPVLAWQFWGARDPAYPPIIPLYLLLVMLGRLALGLCPNDLRGAPRTVSGTIHHAATLLAFTCAYMTVAEATPLLAATVGEPLTGLLSALKHVISLTFVAVVLTITLPLRRYFGLVERIFLYATALWFLTATLTLPPL